MEEIKKVLICGIGAVGSIYANIINSYNKNDLRILVDKSRYEKYTKTPKIFNGKELVLNYILPEDKSFKADLIIIATKFDGLNDAIKNIENFVKDDTIILSLLNGITSEEIIAQKYGWKHIPHAYFIGHSAMRQGNIITHDGTGNIVFGIKNPQITDINDLKLLKNYFNKTGISYKAPQDIYRSLWLKYMLNISSNQPSAILRLTFGQMQNNKKYREFMKNIMREVIEIAKACGVNNTETMIDEAFESFDKMIPEGKTSMLQDVEAGRKTELEIFGTTVVKLGEKYNIPTPYNKFLKEMIEIIDNGK
jgi:2-dehydropantoate 2-reductase